MPPHKKHYAEFVVKATGYNAEHVYIETIYSIMRHSMNKFAKDLLHVAAFCTGHVKTGSATKKRMCVRLFLRWDGV